MKVDIDRILKKWQPRLGLSDWAITVQFRDAQDMNQCPGSTKIRDCIQCADIRVMNIDDRQKSDPGDADVELDIVHELVHVRLWAIDPKDAEGVLYTCREQAIDWIAKALVSADREVMKPETLQQIADIGADFKTFSNSNIGRYLLDKAEQEEIAALKRLRTADPDDKFEIYKLQLAAEVPHRLIKWIEQIINGGEQARAVLEQQDKF